MLKLNIKERSSKFIFGTTLAVSFVAAAFGVYHIFKTNDNANAYLNGFDPGNIMSDFVMGNKSTMSETDIQKFLKSKNTCNHAYDNTVKHYEQQGYKYTIKNNKVVCMADDTFSGETAAHIIWQAAQDYSINPQVLIVLLQKEQGLVTDTWPNHNQYAKATGFACPDNGNGCNSKDAGFKNQIRKAAALFREVLNGGWSNYPAYTTQYVQYSPNANCGGSNIYIQNRATSALYRYTPYQPNQAALNAGWSTATCGAYGNRNFYNYFTEWFGSTKGYGYEMVHGGGIEGGYNAAGGFKNLGFPTGNEQCNLKDNGCYQDFEHGKVYWTASLGAHAVIGGIREKWDQLGYEWNLGYPVNNEIGGLKNGGSWQQFENGVIYWSPSTGAHANRGEVRNKYGQMGFENSYLGYPIDDGGCGLKDNGCYQWFQNGGIYWTPGHGGIDIYGGIKDKWTSLGFENGRLGYPTTGEICKKSGCYREFENGAIYWTNTGVHALYGGIAKRYSNEGGTDNRWIGSPSEDQICGLKNGGCYASFSGNVAMYSSSSGTFLNLGGIREKYRNSGFENGPLGYPTSDEMISGNKTVQHFEHGSILW